MCVKAERAGRTWGWLGPRAFSLMAMLRLYISSASSNCPLVFSRTAMLFRLAATSTWSGPSSFSRMSRTCSNRLSLACLLPASLVVPHASFRLAQCTNSDRKVLCLDTQTMPEITGLDKAQQLQRDL